MLQQASGFFLSIITLTMPRRPKETVYFDWWIAKLQEANQSQRQAVISIAPQAKAVVLRIAKATSCWRRKWQFPQLPEMWLPLWCLAQRSPIRQSLPTPSSPGTWLQPGEDILFP